MWMEEDGGEDTEEALAELVSKDGYLNEQDAMKGLTTKSAMLLALENINEVRPWGTIRCTSSSNNCNC